jgi:hypothetical protein
MRAALAAALVLLASGCMSPPPRPEWVAVSIEVAGPPKKDSLRELWVKVTLRNAGDGPIVVLRPMLGRDLAHYDLSLTDASGETRTAPFADSTGLSSDHGDLDLDKADCLTLEPKAQEVVDTLRLGVSPRFDDWARKPGTYTVVLTYSLDPTAPVTPTDDPEAVALFRRALATKRDSNAVKVTVGKP